VEVPEVPRTTLEGLRVQISPPLETPALVKTAPERLIVPVNPPLAETVIVEFPLLPRGGPMLTEVGLAAREKSPVTVTVTVAV
jgi:hypothetical protein